MPTVSTIVEATNGKKTYAVVVAMLVFAGLGLWLGKLTGDQAITLMLESIAIAGLRDAISKK